MSTKTPKRQRIYTLSKSSGSHAIKGIEQAGNNVEPSAVLWMPSHKVQGGGGKNNPCVSDDVGDEQEDVVVVDPWIGGR